MFAGGFRNAPGSNRRGLAKRDRVDTDNKIVRETYRHNQEFENKKRTDRSMNERNYHLLEEGIGNLQAGLSEFSSLQKIVEMCVHRVKMLREVEQEEEKSTLEDRHENYEKIRLQNKFVPTDSAKETVAREVLSHFLCKMAFAFYTTIEQWETFAKGESIILYDKIKSSSSKIDQYFSAEELKIQPISKAMFESASHKIQSIFSYQNLSEKDKTLFKYEYNEIGGIASEIRADQLIMFRFYDHPNLLKLPYIVLHKGYIIMRKRDKRQVIQNIFSERLLKEMKILNQKYQNNGSRIDDERLAFLKQLPFAEVCDDTTQFTSTAIHASEIDLLSRRDMPACMTYLMNGLKEKSHLRHFGRLQLGLFLKGAGLSLNEALSFWRDKFSKTTTADDFKKKYEYNIKHNYGKLGKQTDYTPMSCSKVIASVPLNGEFHGCPYKSLDSQNLKKFLKSNYQVSDEDFLAVDNYKKNKNYAQACREVYRIRNQPNKSEKKEQMEIFEDGFRRVGNHPNAYFEQSHRLHEPHRYKDHDLKNQKNKANVSSSAQKNQSTMDLEF